MGVSIYSGVGYGFAFYADDIEEIEEELEWYNDEDLFRVVQINADGTVLVGIVFAQHMSGEADHYADFELPDEETRKKLEKIKEKMDCMSDSKFHFFFYYQ